MGRILSMLFLGFLALWLPGGGCAGDDVGADETPHGVTLTLLNCEVFRVVTLPLPTARPM